MITYLSTSGNSIKLFNEGPLPKTAMFKFLIFTLEILI